MSDAPFFESLTRRLAERRSRRLLARLAGGLTISSSLMLSGPTGGAARAKGKKKNTCRQVRDTAVVASYCFRGDVIGSSRVEELGLPFIARRQGRIDRVDVTVLSGPGGEHVVEIRDLNQGARISNAPVLAAAAITAPALASGSERAVTARFETKKKLIANRNYALVVRYLGNGDSNYFRLASAATCYGPGVLLIKPRGETAFTPLADLKLEHTIYVMP